jgi:hypothetical protein
MSYSEWSETRRLLYDTVNLLSKNINTIKKITQFLSDASMDVSPEADTEKKKLCSYLTTRLQVKITRRRQLNIPCKCGKVEIFEYGSS